MTFKELTFLFVLMTTIIVAMFCIEKTNKKNI